MVKRIKESNKIKESSKRIPISKINSRYGSYPKITVHAIKHESGGYRVPKEPKKDDIAVIVNSNRNRRITLKATGQKFPKWKIISSEPITESYETKWNKKKDQEFWKLWKRFKQSQKRKRTVSLSDESLARLLVLSVEKDRYLRDTPKSKRKYGHGLSRYGFQKSVLERVANSAEKRLTKAENISELDDFFNSSNT